jgi:CxxC motif-containing protein (DUF1111 family)
VATPVEIGEMGEGLADAVPLPRARALMIEAAFRLHPLKEFGIAATINGRSQGGHKGDLVRWILDCS